MPTTVSLVRCHDYQERAVHEKLKEAGATPLIGDSPQMGLAHNAADKSGIGAIARDLGIDIVEFEPISVLNPEGKIFKTFTIDNIGLGYKTVEINQHDCLQCLCCVEICPHGAIDLVPRETA